MGAYVSVVFSGEDNKWCFIDLVGKVMNREFNGINKMRLKSSNTLIRFSSISDAEAWIHRRIEPSNQYKVI